jgi:hypothetical protein
MIDTGKADKLVNYKAAGNLVASRHAGLCYIVQARRSPICAPTEVTAEKPPSQQPFGLCTPINPACGGTPTQKSPPSPYFDDRYASSERRLYSGRNFRLPWCGENIALLGNLAFIPIPKLPVRLSHNHHPTAQQNEARGLSSHSSALIYISKYFHIRFSFRHSS